jgi:hypothetical protein
MSSAGVKVVVDPVPLHSGRSMCRRVLPGTPGPETWQEAKCSAKAHLGTSVSAQGVSDWQSAGCGDRHGSDAIEAPGVLGSNRHSQAASGRSSRALVDRALSDSLGAARHGLPSYGQHA